MNLTQMNIISTTEGRNHSEEMEWPSGQQKSPKYNLKNDRMISVCFQGKPFSITVIQVYALTSNAEEAKVEQLYEDVQDLLELQPKKRCPFHYRGLECKSRNSRNTWSNRQLGLE